MAQPTLVLFSVFLSHMKLFLLVNLVIIPKTKVIPKSYSTQELF